MKLTLIIGIILFISGIGSIGYSQDMLTYAGDPKPVNSEPGRKKGFLFEFNAYSRDSELEGITTEMAGVHIFGELTAKKIVLLDQKYTSEVPVVPGNPKTRTIIRKPVIYDSVKKIEKELKKSVNKGEKTLETASSEFNKVLDVALNILTSDTKDFEKTINNTDSVKERIELFTNQVNLKYLN